MKTQIRTQQLTKVLLLLLAFSFLALAPVRVTSHSVTLNVASADDDGGGGGGGGDDDSSGGVSGFGGGNSGSGDNYGGGGYGGNDQTGGFSNNAGGYSGGGSASASSQSDQAAAAAAADTAENNQAQAVTTHAATNATSSMGNNNNGDDDAGSMSRGVAAQRGGDDTSSESGDDTTDTSYSGAYGTTAPNPDTQTALAAGIGAMTVGSDTLGSLAVPGVNAPATSLDAATLSSIAAFGAYGPNAFDNASMPTAAQYNAAQMAFATSGMDMSALPGSLIAQIGQQQIDNGVAFGESLQSLSNIAQVSTAVALAMGQPEVSAATELAALGLRAIGTFGTAGEIAATGLAAVDEGLPAAITGIETGLPPGIAPGASLLGAGQDAAAYMSADGLTVQKSVFGGPDAASLMGTLTNQVADALPEGMVPATTVQGNIISQSFVNGVSYDSLSDEAALNAYNQVNKAINTAKQGLESTWSGSTVDADGVVTSWSPGKYGDPTTVTVGNNTYTVGLDNDQYNGFANFSFNTDGTIAGWFDPVVVRPW